MIYFERIEIPERLRSWVSEAYEIGFDSSDNRSYALEVFPLGMPHLTFVLEGSEIMVHHENESYSMPCPSLCRPLSKRYKLSGKGPWRLLSFSLKPTALYQHFGINFRDMPAYHTNALEVLENCPEELSIALKGSLGRESGIDKILTLLDQNLTGEQSVMEIDKALRLIEHGKMDRVMEICQTLGMSRSKFDKLFKNVIGLSPGDYIHLFRFNRVLKDLHANGFNRFSEVVNKHNYFDHSHLYRDFKSYLGISLEEYKSNPIPLIRLTFS